MSDVVDFQVVDDLQDAVGAEFLVELIETFLNEAPGMIAELKQGEAAGDADVMRRAAHSLKSNANTFGAFLLADAARDVETNGLGDAPDATIDALQDAFDKAAALLKGRLDE